MFNKSDDIKELAIALVKAQKEIESSPKNAVNPFYKSTYADLTSVIGAVKPALNKHGIVFLQAVNYIEGQAVVETILLHETGQYISSLTPAYCLKPNDPQALGTGISYAKRYALQAMLGLPTEDDDGNAASGKVVNAKPAPTPPPKPLAKPPVPDEAEQAILDEVYGKVKALAAVHGKEVDPDKMAAFLWQLKKTYPTDPDKIAKIVPYLIQNLKHITKENENGV